MTLASLSSEEREVVRRTLQATFRFIDFDFFTRLGVTPEEMGKLLSIWPAIDDSGDQSIAYSAINNSLNDLLNGVGISESEAQELVGVSRAEMQRIFHKWK